MRLKQFMALYTLFAENLSIQIRMPNYLKDNKEEYNILKLRKPE